MKTKKEKQPTRAEMIEFLAGHFRYSTMNSWNGQSSYATNVKIRNLKIPKALEDRAYQSLECEATFDYVNEVLKNFGRAHDWRYQIGFNGRSSGYLVLCKGGCKLSEHKSYCPKCGQRSYQVSAPGSDACGVCKAAPRVNRAFFEIFTTGESVGGADAAEMQEWDDIELKDEYYLVKAFDAAVEEARLAFISALEGSEIVEEKYTVTKTRKVLKAR